MNKRDISNQLLELAYSLDNEEERELAGKIETILKGTRPDEDFFLVSAGDMKELERKAKLWDALMDDYARAGATAVAATTLPPTNGDYPPSFRKETIREPVVPGPQPLGGIDAMSPYTRVVLAIEELSNPDNLRYRVGCAQRLVGGLNFQSRAIQECIETALVWLACSDSSWCKRAFEAMHDLKEAKHRMDQSPTLQGATAT